MVSTCRYVLSFKTLTFITTEGDPSLKLSEDTRSRLNAFHNGNIILLYMKSSINNHSLPSITIVFMMNKVHMETLSFTTSLYMSRTSL